MQAMSSTLRKMRFAYPSMSKGKRCGDSCHLRCSKVNVPSYSSPTAETAITT